MKRVIIESPLAGLTERARDRNVRYLRACLRDSLMRGEAPFASHGLYALPGVLSDHVTLERELGISAGFAWRDAASLTALYIDFGISAGMRQGLLHAQALGHDIEERRLYQAPRLTLVGAHDGADRWRRP